MAQQRHPRDHQWFRDLTENITDIWRSNGIPESDLTRIGNELGSEREYGMRLLDSEYSALVILHIAQTGVSIESPVEPIATNRPHLVAARDSGIEPEDYAEVIIHSRIRNGFFERTVEIRVTAS